MIAQVRQRIEGVFHEIQNTGRNPERLLNKTVKGLATHMAAKIASHTLRLNAAKAFLLRDRLIEKNEALGETATVLCNKANPTITNNSGDLFDTISVNRLRFSPLFFIKLLRSNLHLTKKRSLLSNAIALWLNIALRKNMIDIFYYLLS